MLREELAFNRLVAMSLGLPPSLLLQGSGALASGSTSTSSGGDGWSDTAESCNRMVLDTCRHINFHLENLLLEVYVKIYEKKSSPRFQILLSPTVSMEQLIIMLHAHIVDDSVLSMMLQVLDFHFFFIVVVNVYDNLFFKISGFMGRQAF